VPLGAISRVYGALGACQFRSVPLKLDPGMDPAAPGVLVQRTVEFHVRRGWCAPRSERPHDRVGEAAALSSPSSSLTRALAGIALAGGVVCVVLVALAIDSVGGHHRDLIAIFGPVIGGAFIGTGPVRLATAPREPLWPR
jgi:hypothetical protein